MHAAVHQFHSGTASGDAITNQLFALQRDLRQRGIASEIFAEHIPDELSTRVRPVSELRYSPSTRLVVHHSIGHTALDRLLEAGMPITTVFHSITPARFFHDDFNRSFIELGYRQLRDLARVSQFGLADSNHNRREMYDAGFRDVDVLPVRLDFTELSAVRFAEQRGTDWLFVGRMVPNKRQAELVEAFAHYHRSDPSAVLHLVGDMSYWPYVNHVRFVIDRLGIDAHVVLHGKVGIDRLRALYAQSGVFVSASEHEGFGVPLLEAMAAGLPVVARNAAAVAETLGGAGVLVEGGDPLALAGAAALVLRDADVRGGLLEVQNTRLRVLTEADYRGVIDRLVQPLVPSRPMSVQIQGPFETSYSLAVVNRSLAEALCAGADIDISIRAAEGYGDYKPDLALLEKFPVAARLWANAEQHPFPDVVIRQMFPPRVDDSTGGVTLQYFGWEESLLPADYVEQFNRHLDGVGVMSTFVRDVLRDSGVAVPVEVVGVIVHEPQRDANAPLLPELERLPTTRFLNIGSAFPRKGVDALLRGYFSAFTGDDDVVLLLKTFPNPHADVGLLLRELGAEHPNPPAIRWINRDLTGSEIAQLYEAATAYVHTARGEGFGLPVAEAMLARVPVISVASTGLGDFVNDATAAVIGHSMAPARTHLSVPGSLWTEPSVDDLVKEFRAVVDRPADPERALRVDAAEALIRREYSDAAVADRWRRLIESVRRSRPGRNVLAITTFNSRCGIAEYSAGLYRGMGEWVGVEVHADVSSEPLDPSAETGIRRTWQNYRRGVVDPLLDVITESPADVVHIQYNMGFYSIPELGRLLDASVRRKPTVLTLHRTLPAEVDGTVESLSTIAESLRAADAVIVHQHADVERLNGWGVRDNVVLLPIGCDPVHQRDLRAARERAHVSPTAFVIGAYGFLLPHKGLLELVRALGQLRDEGLRAHLVAACALHPDPRSPACENVVRAEISKLGLEADVTLQTNYLTHDESLELLACSDVIALPYGPTEESSSAALKTVLALGRPIVTSDVPIFDEAEEFAVRIPSPVTVDDLAAALRRLAHDPALRAEMASRTQRYARLTSWAQVARRTRELYAHVCTKR